MRLGTLTAFAVVLPLSCTPAKMMPTGPTGPTTNDPNPFKIKLTDVTEAALGSLIRSGLNLERIGIGNGATVGDLDGDGLPDIVLARVDNPMDSMDGASGPSLLLHNTSNGSISFETIDSFSTFSKGIEVFGAAIGDYDKDGRLDVFLCAKGKDILLHNEGNLKFKNVTDAAGVGGPMNDFSTSAVFADLNNDGLPDLFVGEYGHGMNPSAKRLYLNQGDGTFLDISADSKVASDLGAEHVAAIADLDGDGVLDIWIANDTLSVDKRPPPGVMLPFDGLLQGQGLNAKGNPTYLDVGGDRGIQANRASMGLGIADFDGDGFLDVMVSDNGPTDLYLWRPDKMAYDESSSNLKAALGTVTDDGGKTQVLVHWGVHPLDLDHDGLLEIYMAAGSLSARMPDNEEQFYQLDNFVRQSKPGGEFTEITGAVGLPAHIKVGDFSIPLSQRGVYTGDLDMDGKDDLVIGAYDEAYRVYHNETPDNGNHYVRLRLVGSVSAPDPVGAIVTITTKDGKMIKKQRVAGGDTYGYSDFITEVGLGKQPATAISVAWPSGLVQEVETLDGYASDAEFEVDEPKWLTLSARVVALAGGAAPVLSIMPFDDQGVIQMGADAAGRMVTVTRSDKVKVTVTQSNGVFKATLAKPATPKRVTLTINIDGNDMPIQPMITFK